MLNAVVCVSGGGTNLQALIDCIADGRITNTRIVRVISNNRNAYALERAKANGIEGICVCPRDYEDREQFHQALLRTVEEASPDMIVLAGFLVAIPSAMVQKYPNKIINIHPALIPSFCGRGYYGLRVHQAVLERGVKVTGATVHFVDEGTDTGPIILQKPVPVEPFDTPEVLQKRVMEQAEWVILPRAVNLYANGCLTVADGKALLREEPITDADGKALLREEPITDADGKALLREEPITDADGMTLREEPITDADGMTLLREEPKSNAADRSPDLT